MNTPFNYTLDSKRYHTWNYYLRNRFQSKVAKVPLDAFFTCPNRDGKLAYGGCHFCSAQGSGEFPSEFESNLQKQFDTRYKVMSAKWPNCKAMAYFQAFTNTYADIDTLKRIFKPFVDNEQILGLCIGTRTDCIDDMCLEYLDEISNKKEVWIEFGLQSIHDTTTDAMNCHHNYEQFLDTISRLSKTSCKICVHLLNGLPNETAEMMIDSAKAISKLPIHAIKIHMLHIIKGSRLASDYISKPWGLLSMEEYVSIVVKQLEVIPENIIIQRLTGDGMEDSLIAPIWTKKKTIVLNNIDKEMVKLNTWQGKEFNNETPNND